jgi:hypothetical protein
LFFRNHKIFSGCQKSNYNKSVENGKSEIGVLTLVLFAIELNKTISYFFPKSLLKDQIADVKTPFQHKILEIAEGIEHFGDIKFTLDILKVMSNHFETDFEASINGYPHEDFDEDEK